MTPIIEDEALELRISMDRERVQIARRYAKHDEMPAHAVAELLPMFVHLLKAEVDAGRLKTADDVKTVRYGDERMPRRWWATVLIDRDALRAWLQQYGTDAQKQSHAARWCGLVNE